MLRRQSEDYGCVSGQRPSCWVVVLIETRRAATTGSFNLKQKHKPHKKLICLHPLVGLFLKYEVKLSKNAGNTRAVLSRVATLGTLDDGRPHRPLKTALSARAMRDYCGMILGWTRKSPRL